MMQLVLPLWLAIVFGVTLLVLLAGTLVGLGMLLRQGMQGQVDFQGSMPINEFSTDAFARSVATPNPRLDGVDPRTQAQLLEDVRNAQAEQARPGAWRHPGER